MYIENDSCNVKYMYHCICGFILKRNLDKGESTYDVRAGNVYAQYASACTIYIYIPKRCLHGTHSKCACIHVHSSRKSVFKLLVPSKNKPTLYMHISYKLFLYIQLEFHHWTTSSPPTEAALAGNVVSLKKVDDLHTATTVEEGFLP